MKLALMSSALLLASSPLFASEPLPLLPHTPVGNVVSGTGVDSYYSYYIEFNDLLYVMFLQTSETSSPIEVNDFDIRFDYNDDPNEFYKIFNLP